MAKKTQTSAIFNKALQAHATDETDYGMEFIDLPAGISGGIAQLVDCHIGVYQKGNNQGKKFCYLGGVVQKPDKAVSTVKRFEDGAVVVVSRETVEVRGQRTSQSIPLCETTKANGDTIELDDHVKRMLNELRMLGADTAEIVDDNSLETLLSALQEAKPYFKFSTSESEPNELFPDKGRVWENWHGARGLEEWSPNNQPADVVDETDEVDDVDTTVEDDTRELSDDLHELGEAADNSDTASEDRLKELAKAAGLTEEEINDTPNWVGVAELTESRGGTSAKPSVAETSLLETGKLADQGDGPSISRLEEDARHADVDPDEFETWAELAAELGSTEAVTPVKGENYLYKPPKARKAVECEATAVFEGKQTCNLKNLDDHKPYKGVAWSELEEID